MATEYNVYYNHNYYLYKNYTFIFVFSIFIFFNLYFTQPAPALKLQDLATWKYHVGPIPIKIYNPPKIAENPKIGRIILSDNFTSSSLLLIFDRVLTDLSLIITLGRNEESSVELIEGSSVGLIEGLNVGFLEGLNVGFLEGLNEGFIEGLNEGL